MRISTNLFFQNGLKTINTQQADLMHIYQQVGTGKRLITPSDDPLAAAQTINIAQSQSLNQRYTENRQVAKNNLSSEENTLDAVSTLLSGLKTRLVEAGNSTLADVDRATLANVLSKAKDNLLGLANATDGNGQYLFSGHAGSRAPFAVAADGSVSYVADSGSRLIQVDQTRQLDSADTGDTIFMSATSGSRAYISRANAANQGTAEMSAPAITDPNDANVGNAFTVDFADNAGSLEYTVTFTTETGTPPTPTTTTLGPTAFEPGAATLTVSPGLQVKFSGTPQAGDSFTVEPAQSTDLNIFNTLDDMIAALKTPIEGDPKAAAAYRNTLSSAMQRLDVNYDQVQTTLSSVGTRMAEIDSIDARSSVRNLSYSKELSRLEDVDYYEATAQLQLRTAALDAASMAFKKIQSTSLFNMSN